jgi:hypothetical protein
LQRSVHGRRLTWLVAFAVSLAVLLLIARPAYAYTFTVTEGVNYTGQIGTVSLNCKPVANGETFDCGVLPASIGAQVAWTSGGTMDTGAKATKTACAAIASTCVYDVFATPGITYSGAGTFQVTFRVPNAYGAASANPRQGTSTAVVLGLGKTVPATGLSATKGVASSFVLGSFSDTDPAVNASSFTASVYWGDQTPNVAGTITAGSGGTYSISASHTYTSTGVETVAVTIELQGSGGGPAFETTITVGSAPATTTTATTSTATTTTHTTTSPATTTAPATTATTATQATSTTPTTTIHSAIPTRKLSLSGFVIRPRVVKASSSLRISFRLSGKASVTVTFARKEHGRYVTVRMLARAGHAGSNSIVYAAGSSLKPGSYEVKLKAFFKRAVTGRHFAHLSIIVR